MLHHVVSWFRSWLPASLNDLKRTETNIMAKVNELAAQLTVVKEQVTKAKNEVIKRIADLEAALANVDLPPDAEAALTALKAEVQAVDDLNPDAPPPPPEPPTPT